MRVGVPGRACDGALAQSGALDLDSDGRGSVIRRQFELDGRPATGVKTVAVVGAGVLLRLEHRQPRNLSAEGITKGVEQRALSVPVDGKDRIHRIVAEPQVKRFAFVIDAAEALDAQPGEEVA